MKPGGQPSTEDPQPHAETGAARASDDDKENEAGARPQAAIEEPGQNPDPPAGGPRPAVEPTQPQRVDWAALLEERALVPDSVEASPVAEPKIRAPEPKPRRGLLHAVVALTSLFTLIASAAVVIALVRDSDVEPSREPPPPPSAPTDPAATAPPAPAPAETAPATPAPTETTPTEATPPKAGPAEPTQAAPAEPPNPRTPEAAAGAPGQAKEKHRGKSGKEKTSASASHEPQEKAERGGGAAGEPGKGDEAEAPSDGARPSGPSAKDLAKAVEGVKPAIDGCAKQNGVSGTAAIKLQVEPDGSIAWAAVREGGGAFQTCISRVLRGIHLPASENGGTLIHSVTLPDP